MENQVREDEVEIDLLELFQVLLGKIGIIIVSLIIGAGLLFSGTKFFYFNDIYLNKDNECDFFGRYSDGKPVDKRLCDFGDKSSGCEDCD